MSSQVNFEFEVRTFQKRRTDCQFSKRLNNGYHLRVGARAPRRMLSVGLGFSSHVNLERECKFINCRSCRRIKYVGLLSHVDCTISLNLRLLIVSVFVIPEDALVLIERDCRQAKQPQNPSRLPRSFLFLYFRHNILPDSFVTSPVHHSLPNSLAYYIITPHLTMPPKRAPRAPKGTIQPTRRSGRIASRENSQEPSAEPPAPAPTPAAPETIVITAPVEEEPAVTASTSSSTSTSAAPEPASAAPPPAARPKTGLFTSLPPMLLPLHSVQSLIMAPRQ
jgi:hypothetical protein